MANVKIRLDHAGIAELLKSAEMAQVVNEAAAAVAVQAGGEMESYTTDRAAAAVTVKADRQARDGALTRAAQAVGLEVQQVLLYTTKAGKTRKATAAQIANWTRGRK